METSKKLGGLEPLKSAAASSEVAEAESVQIRKQVNKY